MSNLIPRELIELEIVKHGIGPSEFARAYDFKKSTVAYYLKKYGIKIRRTEDYSGRVIHRLTVIKRSHRSESGHTVWLCKCECGNEVYLKSCTLACRSTRSCGCHRIKNRQNHKNWCGVGEIHGSYFKSLRRGARHRNISYDISKEYAWNLFLKQNRKCALSGLDIKFAPTVARREEQTASLDRKDSKSGYTEGNVQWVHKDINKMKQDLTDNIFTSYCEAVCKHNKEKDN